MKARYKGPQQIKGIPITNKLSPQSYFHSNEFKKVTISVTVVRSILRRGHRETSEEVVRTSALVLTEMKYIDFHEQVMKRFLCVKIFYELYLHLIVMSDGTMNSESLSQQFQELSKKIHRYSDPKR